MDVRDAGGDRVDQDLLQVPDDRRVLDLRAFLVAALRAVGFLEIDLQVLHRGDVLQRGAGGLDQLVDRGRQLVVLDDDGLDDEVRLEPDLLQALQVGRVGRGDVEPVAALVQRQNVPRLGNLEVDQLFRELVGVESRKVEQRDAERARREHRKLVRRDLLAGDDVVYKRGPGLLRLRLQRLGLEFRHEAVLRERAREAADVARRCGVRGHGLGFESG